MTVISELIEELEASITTVIDNGGAEDSDTAQLIRKCGEAVGVLRCVGDFDLKKIMYDMSRLAAGAGWTPDDFDRKAQ